MTCCATSRHGRVVSTTRSDPNAQGRPCDFPAGEGLRQVGSGRCLSSWSEVELGVAFPSLLGSCTQAKFGRGNPDSTPLKLKLVWWCWGEFWCVWVLQGLPSRVGKGVSLYTYRLGSVVRGPLMAVEPSSGRPICSTRREPTCMVPCHAVPPRIVMDGFVQGGTVSYNSERCGYGLPLRSSSRCHVDARAPRFRGDHCLSPRGWCRNMLYHDYFIPSIYVCEAQC